MLVLLVRIWQRSSCAGVSGQEFCAAMYVSLLLPLVVLIFVANMKLLSRYNEGQDAAM